ncbi:MAG: substrate-binding domain-containing protein [Planctomycetota bacterium]
MLSSRIALLSFLLLPAGGCSDDSPEGTRGITLASTTSTENSGLLGDLLPKFTAQTGIEVRVVAVGTGKAMKLGENGDVDLVLVHHRASEDQFLAEGYGSLRKDVMYNDFLIVGPEADTAGIRGQNDVVAAMKQIAAAQAPFASRGDDSGTHKKELELWAAAGIAPESGGENWYRSTGSGMGATLNLAAELEAYALTDRGTWLSFLNRRTLVPLSEGDALLKNPYGILLVNPEKHPHVHEAEARKLIDWITSDEGRQEIAGFRISGEQLFFPTK